MEIYSFQFFGWNAVPSPPFGFLKTTVPVKKVSDYIFSKKKVPDYILSRAIERGLGENAV